MAPSQIPLQGEASRVAILQPYVVYVGFEGYAPTWEKTIRYAVLAATAAEALEAVRVGLAFGDRASLSDEALTNDEVVEMALVLGKPRIIA